MNRETLTQACIYQLYNRTLADKKQANDGASGFSVSAPFDSEFYNVFQHLFQAVSDLLVIRFAFACRLHCALVFVLGFGTGCSLGDGVAWRSTGTGLGTCSAGSVLFYAPDH
jgi:hypothetical protein